MEGLTGLFVGKKAEVQKGKEKKSGVSVGHLSL